MKGIALGVCQWKDEHLWYGEKIWIQEDEGLRTTIISQCHDSSLAGHGGTAKTTELVSQQYYWPKMRETIKRYVKNCDTCQRSQAVRHAPYGLLQPNKVPDQPWRSIAIHRQARSGTLFGCSSPYGACRTALLLWHVSQFFKYHLIVSLIFGQ